MIDERFAVISAALDTKLAERDEGYLRMAAKVRKLEDKVDSQALTISRQSQEIYRLIESAKVAQIQRQRQTLQIQRMKETNH